eukprot:scaffold4157_cov58-Attheya_sp.AAC.3
MGRRKRCDDDAYDDSVERAYSGEAPKQASQEISKEKSDDEIERMRLKKKAKKELQKQKKEVAQKKEAKLREAKRKQNEDVNNLREEIKKRKVIEKTKPASKSFVGTQKGVKYCDILIGKGPLIEEGKKVQVKYVLRAEHKQGKVLDSGDNFSFRLGKGDVISGWDIGLLGMKQGGIRHLIVPPKAGYGSKDIGGGPLNRSRLERNSLEAAKSVPKGQVNLMMRIQAQPDLGGGLEYVAMPPFTSLQGLPASLVDLAAENITPAYQTSSTC